MKKRESHKTVGQFPVVVTKDEDGFYVAECAAFQGCYTQGKTLNAALKNIREVIALCMEEKSAPRRHMAREVSIHTVSV
ncbi:MAG: type II toxin-antitoxin system HicB family antitoxin [Patescibacteria group bacterium]